MAGIGSGWLDGSLVFETGRTSRKERNLTRDPRCTISLALEDFLVVEGEAQLVTDPAVVAEVARMYNQDGWPCEVDESGTAPHRTVRRGRRPVPRRGTSIESSLEPPPC